MPELVKNKKFNRIGLRPARIPKVYDKLHENLGKKYTENLESGLRQLIKTNAFARKCIKSIPENITSINGLRNLVVSYAKIHNEITQTEQKHLIELNKIANKIVLSMFDQLAVKPPIIKKALLKPSDLFGSENTKSEMLSEREKKIVNAETKRLMFQSALVQAHSLKAMNLIGKYKKELDAIDSRFYPAFTALTKLMELQYAGFILLRPAERKALMTANLAIGSSKGQSFFQLQENKEGNFELKPARYDASHLTYINFPAFVYEMTQLNALASMSEAEAHLTVLPKKLCNEVIRRIDNAYRESVNYYFGPLIYSRLDPAISFLARVGLQSRDFSQEIKVIRNFNKSTGSKQSKEAFLKRKQELYGLFSNIEPGFQEKLIERLPDLKKLNNQETRTQFFGFTRELALALLKAKKASY